MRTLKHDKQTKQFKQKHICWFRLYPLILSKPYQGHISINESFKNNKDIIPYFLNVFSWLSMSIGPDGWSLILSQHFISSIETISVPFLIHFTVTNVLQCSFDFFNVFFLFNVQVYLYNAWHIWNINNIFTDIANVSSLFKQRQKKNAFVLCIFLKLCTWVKWL